MKLAWLLLALHLLLLAPPATAAPSQADACAQQFPIPFALREVTGPGRMITRETVTLPDTLPIAWRNEAYRVRYRIDVSACAASPGAALWLFRVGAPYRAVTDRGVPLILLSGSPPPPHESLLQRVRYPDVNNGRIPTLFALPPGTREVAIELQSLPYIPAGLVRVQAGGAIELLPYQAGAVDEFVAYADAAAGVLLVLGLLALLLWTQRRADRGLLWLALGCGLWGLRGLGYYSHAVYGSPTFFEQLNPLNVLLTAAALSASVLHLLGGPARAHRALAGLTLLCTLVLGVSVLTGTGAAWARGLNVCSAFLMCAGLLVHVIRIRRQVPAWQTLLMTTGLGAVVASGAHDLSVVTGALPPDSPTYVFWGFVLLLAGFAVLSGQYVVRMLSRAERSNEELERHVQRKTAELEFSYARLRDSERDAARAQERERLLRDMHDGLGAHLMTALRGVERGTLDADQTAQSLQDSLDELRLLMDSTDMEGYLPGALASWRNRWDRRLRGAGVELQWRIDESLDAAQVPSDATLQVMRILQEAATNIVKHAQARQMTLDARIDEPGRPGATLCIEIADDGVGLPPHAAASGARGLKNMQFRAQQIGARLCMGPRGDGTGTRLTLECPLGAAGQLALPRGADGHMTRPRRAASSVASARDEMPSLR